MKIMSMVAAAFVLAVAGGDAAAQQRSLKERLVGTWHLVLSEVTSPDGTKTLPFGPNPAGVMMFAADGNYTHIHVAAEVPKIANNHRLKATPEEYAGIVRGSIAQFGTWTIDEEKRHLILKQCNFDAKQKGIGFEIICFKWEHRSLRNSVRAWPKTAAALAAQQVLPQS